MAAGSRAGGTSCGSRAERAGQPMAVAVAPTVSTQ